MGMASGCFSIVARRRRCENVEACCWVAGLFDYLFVYFYFGTLGALQIDLVNVCDGLD